MFNISRNNAKYLLCVPHSDLHQMIMMKKEEGEEVPFPCLSFF